MATIKLNRKNYFSNLDQITKHVGSKDKVCVVLKDNAYGHGLLEIATLANEYGIKKAVVKNMYEAKIIEKLFDEILILAETKYETYSHTFHITINELEDIKKIPENAFVHLKIDTGMHRNGIAQNEIEEAIKGILKHKLVLKGVFTHHRNADSLTCEYFWQKCQFNVIKKQVKSLCEKLSLDIPSFHACNTSALFRTKSFDDDFARVGLAQFGYIETNSIFERPNLKPVLSLYAKKLSTRKIISGQSIGYGGTFTAHKDMDISNYDVGYGDGFFRLNEQHHFTTPDNYKVLGRVSMDNLSLDSCDDEVCIFNDVKSLAKIHQTITYEILTSLSPYIKREIE